MKQSVSSPRSISFGVTLCAALAASSQLLGCASDAGDGAAATGSGGVGGSAGAGGASDSAGAATAGAGAAGSALPAVHVDSKPSAGCGQPTSRRSDGGNSIDVKGVSRSFVLHLPSGYDATKPWPLVFAFHGKGDLAENLDGGNFRFQMLGGAANVLVYPQALPDPKLNNQPSFERDAADDLLFIDALLGDLESGLCIDESRVFALGHSLGSTFVQTLGCQRAGTIRGIAPQSGGAGATASCGGPVAAWIGYGLQDSASAVAVSKARKAFWLAANHCDLATESKGSPSPPCVSYRCDSGYPVEWCEEPLGTHSWSPWMTESIFDFFGAFAP